jgi:hypothetical protein
VGIIVGIMFLGFAFQQFTLAGLADSLSWVYAILGVLFVAAAVLAFISPENTFAAIADILGFLFLCLDRRQPAVVADPDRRDPDGDPRLLHRRRVFHS